MSNKVHRKGESARKSMARSVSYHFHARIDLPMTGERFRYGKWRGYYTHADIQAETEYLANKAQARKLFDKAIEAGVIDRNLGFKDYGREYGEVLTIWFYGKPGKEMRELIGKLGDLFPTMVAGPECE
jgi:hypothetical protein